MRPSIFRAVTAAVASLSLAAIVSSASAGAFVSSGDLVAVQVNTTNSNGAGAVTLGEYADTNGNVLAAPVNTVALPSTGTNEFVENVSSDHDAQLELTSTGNALVLAGYHDAATDTVAPGGQSSTVVPREVAVIYADGTANTSTQFTNAFSARTVRSVASVDGTQFWVAGKGAAGTTATDGIQYISTLGATGASAAPLTPLLSNVSGTGYSNTAGYDDVRGVKVINGQLYGSTGSSSLGDHGVFTVGTGAPTTNNNGAGQNINFLNTDNSSGDQFTLLNLSGTAAGFGATGGFGGYDTLYTAASQNGIAKYSYANGVWSLDGSYVGGANAANYLDLAVKQIAGGVELYVSSLSEIYELTDTTGFDGALTGTPTGVLAAPANTYFKGLAFAPTAVPEPTGLLLFLGGPTLAMLRRRKPTIAK